MWGKALVQMNIVFSRCFCFFENWYCKVVCRFYFLILAIFLVEIWLPEEFLDDCERYRLAIPIDIYCSNYLFHDISYPLDCATCMVWVTNITWAHSSKHWSIFRIYFSSENTPLKRNEDYLKLVYLKERYWCRKKGYRGGRVPSRILLHPPPPAGFSNFVYMMDEALSGILNINFLATSMGIWQWCYYSSQLLLKFIHSTYIQRLIHICNEMTMKMVQIVTATINICQK